MSFDAHGRAGFETVLDANPIIPSRDCRVSATPTDRLPLASPSENERAIDAISSYAWRSAANGVVVGDRAPAEAALRPSAESLQLIVDTIPGLVAIATTDGTLELVNHRVLEYLGKTFEELKKWTTSDAVHPDDLSGTVAAWNRSMNTGTPFTSEHRLRRRDGTHRWFQWRAHPLRNADGRVVRWYSLITDIDDLKRAEMKLRQDEAELRQIADYSPDAIIVFSADGQLLYANRFSLEYSGLSVEDFRGGGWRERIYHPDDIDEFTEAKTKGLALGAPFEVELRILRADGKYRWSRIRYNPLLDDAGERHAMVRDAYRYRGPQAGRRTDEERQPGVA